MSKNLRQAASGSPSDDPGTTKDFEFTQIAADWSSVTLGEENPKALLAIRNGLTTKQDQNNGDYKVSRIETIGGGWIDETRVRFASDLKEKDLEKYRIQKGDILFSHINSDPHLGKTGFAERDYEDLLHGMNLLLIRANPEVFEAEFLNRVFQYYREIGVFISICSRSVNQSSINQSKLKAVEVPLPPLPEQKKIAHILSMVQRAIEAQERIIQTTTELKKALMHKLFTEGLHNEPPKQTEIGPAPESWMMCKVGDVAKIQSGGTPARDIADNWSDGTIPWVKTGEINYCVIHDTEEKITPVGLTNSAARLFPEGTLLMAMYGQGITRGRVGLLGIEAATNQACASITPTDKRRISSKFLYYFFEYHYEDLRKLGHGANQRNMNAALIRSFPLMLPKLHEQAAMVTVFESLDEKRVLHERKWNQLQNLFRTLLQELMTAKIRIHDVNLQYEIRS